MSNSYGSGLECQTIPQLSQPIPRYKCHKEVAALKIKEIQREALPKWKRATCKGCYALRTACGHCERCAWELEHGSRMKLFIIPADPNFAPIEVDQAYLEKHKPEPGGYYVVYQDGYKSFSPAAAFEEGYSLI